MDVSKSLGISETSMVEIRERVKTLARDYMIGIKNRSDCIGELNNIYSGIELGYACCGLGYLMGGLENESPNSIPK